MNKLRVYEVLAATLAVAGVVLLGFVYYPILNPTQYRLNPGPQIALWLRYSLGTILSGVMLSLAWFCNIRAKKVS